MSQHNRRTFIKGTAAAGVGFWVAGSSAFGQSKSPNEKINFACVGVGGKGSSDSADAGRHGQVVGICDVDDNTVKKSGARFKDAEQFNDYREMFEKLGDKIDAVTVSTPDHMHAVVAAAAMKAGKHCFCQKPMTKDIYEARFLGDLAKEKGVKTQMGNQGTSRGGLRKSAALIQAGMLGTIKEVHVWTNRPVWAQGGDRPAPQDPPANLHWDLWLGTAPKRPFGKGYHPFSWRGWWDFGTGALGDMACHTFNMPFMALNLRDPLSVEAESSGHNGDSFPKWSQIKFEFPEIGGRPALPVWWYDGGKRPPAELLPGEKMSRSGFLLIGEKGKLYSTGDYGSSYKIISDTKLEEPKVEYPNSPGHFKELVDAINGGPEAMSNFPNYAGPLTETILLGNLAVWSGKKVEWDAKNLKSTNLPELAKIVKREYAGGYSL